jgi:hypothetical protein
LKLSNVYPSEVATEWLNGFSAAITRSDVGAAVDHFIKDGFQKDVIAVTWISGHSKEGRTSGSFWILVSLLQIHTNPVF